MKKPNLDVVPHIETLWRFARTLTRNDADADDLVQEALSRALALSHSYDPARPLAAWLVTIVRNTYLTGETRKRAEARRMETLATLAEPYAPAVQEDRLELQKVWAAFENLPREQAEVLHLVGILGFSYQEAAEIVGTPVGTVMSRLNRARAALRDRTGESDRSAAARLRVVGGQDEQA